MSPNTPRLKVSVFYASLGDHVHENVQKQADDLVDDIKGTLTNATATVGFVGAEQLVKLAQKRPPEAYKLSLADTPISTSSRVFIVLVKLTEFFNFITDEEHNLLKHIFESNVRDYQGKTTVNQEIQNTLRNPSGEEFWWLVRM